MKKTVLKVIFSGFISVLLVLIAVEGTLAWLIDNSSVTVTNKDIGVAVDTGNIELSLDGENWGNYVSFDSAEMTYTVDITGDGLKFWYPTQLDTNDEPIITSADSFREITAENQNGYYISFDLFVRSTTATSLYLSNKSVVSGFEQYITNSKSAYARRSMYGDFSCDGIAGAVRVSMVDITDEENPLMRCIWAPNDTYELSIKNGSIYTLNENGTPESTAVGYSYIDCSTTKIEEVEFTGMDYASGRFVFKSSELATDDTVNGAVPLLTFEQSKVYVYKKLRVNIWIEGTDREANKALNSGIIKYTIVFTAIDKKDAEHTLSSDMTNISEEVRNIVWQDGNFYYSDNGSELTKYDNNKLHYSFDGKTWNSGSVAIAQGTEDKAVYVYENETTGRKRSNVVRVVIPAQEATS